MKQIKKVAVIGNHLPRKCGIATFTTDIVDAISKNNKDIECWSVAINDRPEGYNYPEKVRFEINQNKLNEYKFAADYLNINQVDIVSLQHEYGIFGGEWGNYIINLLSNLRMPIVTTLHTILENPTIQQKKILNDVISLSSHIVIMAEKARFFLKNIHQIPENKISFIQHGIPDMPFVDSNFYKDQFGVEGKKVILTFGLLSPNKGIEYMIEALPQILKKHPNVVYMIVGATHPYVKKANGEEYRESLKLLAKNKGVDKNIMFFNRFVEAKELSEFLGACDVYVTPYLNEAQITSGTLAYAMGLGKATVSTPYWHAVEMMAEGRGLQANFKDSNDLAKKVIKLFDNEVCRNTIRKKAYHYSRKAVWSQVAIDYLTLFKEVKTERKNNPRLIFETKTLEQKKLSLPEVNLNHLNILTDDTGIIQHACYSIPDYSHGYCTDDNARALIVSVMAQGLMPDDNTLIPLQKKYLAFIKFAFNKGNGWFRNFMSFSRKWLEEKGSEDSQGRVVWALGVSSALSSEKGCIDISTTLFHKSLKMLEKLNHPRALAFSLIGLHAYLSRFSGDTEVRRIKEKLAIKLFSFFECNLDDNWHWFEDKLSYANGKIPQALLLSGQSLQNKDMLEAGYKILNWLINIQIDNERFSAIGNNGWFYKGLKKARFDQQPIECHSLLETCLLAYHITNNEYYNKNAHMIFNWYLGQNDINEPLYDCLTGGCKDGLTPDGANLNQGAESTLAWLLSLLLMHNFKDGKNSILYTKLFEE